MNNQCPLSFSIDAIASKHSLWTQTCSTGSAITNSPWRSHPKRRWSVLLLPWTPLQSCPDHETIKGVITLSSLKMNNKSCYFSLSSSCKLVREKQENGQSDITTIIAPFLILTDAKGHFLLPFKKVHFNSTDLVARFLPFLCDLDLDQATVPQEHVASFRSRQHLPIRQLNIPYMQR